MGNTNKPRIYNQNMEWVAVLDKATDVGYRQVMNSLWMANFTLPADDPKNGYCQPFFYVEIFDGDKRVELFRIMKDQLVRSQKGHVTYLCEHVITTLIDDIMFQYHQIGNIGVFTPEVINYILSFQEVQNWRLGQCAFNHQFLYKWESENLLAALCDVPKPFAEEWHFTYDTTTYPWTVNLVRAENILGCEIRYRKNMQGISRERDVKNLFTRIYPLGYGEGDNQLTIKDVNNGVPYLQSETASIYGIKSVPWVDRRFEDAENMKATAAGMLKKFSVPFVSYSVDSIDLFKRTGQGFDEFKEGKIVRVIDKRDGINVDTRIMEITKHDVTKADVNVVIANRERNIAGSIADSQRRQRIHDTYAQGAESITQMSFADNCQPEFPAIFEFFIPASMVNLNFATLRVRLEPFRADSRAIRGGGGRTATSTDGGRTETSTEGGGATTQTTTQQQQQTPTTSSQETRSTSTEDGGATTSGASNTTTTDTANIDIRFSGISNFQGGTTTGPATTGITVNAASADTHWHNVIRNNDGAVTTVQGPMATLGISINEPIIGHSHPNTTIPGHEHFLTVPGHSHEMAHTHSIGAHSHTVTIPGHSHTVTIPAHGHSVTIPSHTHNVSIPAHSHNITMPDHTHDIEFGIFQGTRANSISIRVDGNTVPIAGSLDNIDIRPFLRRDGGGRVVRNAWHRFEIIPDRLTRISAHLFLIVASNSRGGANL